MRERCWKCRRPKAVCLCNQVKPFDLEPLLVLLIHPREAKKTVGTVRLVQLSIPESRVWVGDGTDLDRNSELIRLVTDPRLFPVVLFPGPSSLNLSLASAPELKSWVPPGRRLTVLVIDGTWSHAHKMMRTSKVLLGLPRVSFEVSTPSRYRFRKQPEPYCLSTVEAVHLLIENLYRAGLCKLPLANGHDSMLKAFHWMVEAQIQFSAVNDRQRKSALA